MIYLGCDHGGFALKEAIRSHLEKQGLAVTDCGNTTFDSEDDSSNSIVNSNETLIILLSVVGFVILILLSSFGALTPILNTGVMVV